MFELKWNNKSIWKLESTTSSCSSLIRKGDIAKVLKLQWEEHCVECAVPECYSSCAMYARRDDGACARFSYGILANTEFKGHYDFGADIKFKKWAKLEANLYFSFLAPIIPHNVHQVFTKLPEKIQICILEKLRQKPVYVLKNIDEFILECYSPNRESFQLIIEYFTQENNIRTIKFRNSFLINPGQNLHRILFSEFNMTSSVEGYVCVYPDNNLERRLIFTWLDFVAYKRNRLMYATDKQVKIKCIAWDLDNTLWEGILAEDIKPRLKPESRKLLFDLDARGIIQTIVSKNNYDEVVIVLKEMGIADYFLFPAINWGQKSENLKKIAEKLNLDLNTFAVIDDSDFERHEISVALPQVRVYNEKEIHDLIQYPELDVPISSVARKRRLSYLEEIQRNIFIENYSGSYDEFLMSCGMILRIYVPLDEEEIQRLLELIHRSNQLNLSSKRYSQNEFKSLLVNPDILSLSLSCKDKFGDYGIIGFASINFSSGVPVLEDFLLSCRVARKKVEHTFIRQICSWLELNGYKKISVSIIKTPKNLPLRKVFADFPFIVISEDEMKINFEMLTVVENLPSDVMEVSIDTTAFVLQSRSSL